jgi:predicted transposase YbfD/YdcC
MEAQELLQALRPLTNVPDPRAKNIRHPWRTIVTITAMAATCGVTECSAIREWACIRQANLELLLSLPHGIPSKRTFERFLQVLDGKRLTGVFLEALDMLRSDPKAKAIAIDGKTMRGSKRDGSDGLHVVNAFATDTGMVLQQEVVNGKGHELAGLRVMLEVLDLKGALVTVDAAGTHVDMAQQIKKKGGDYLLPVKANQPNLHRDLSLNMQAALTGGIQAFKYECHTEVEKGHGRLEVRKVCCTQDLGWLPGAKAWPDIKMLVGVEYAHCRPGKPEKREYRYFLTSWHEKSPQQLLQAIRNHWRIENSLHWVLDVVFGEDRCRVAHEKAARNLAILRRLAYNILRSYPDPQTKSLKRRMAWCAGNFGYLLKVLSHTAAG